MAMQAGGFLVGTFSSAALIFDCEEANVQVSTEDQDSFRKNLPPSWAEERLALGVRRPQALITGSFIDPGSPNRDDRQRRRWSHGSFWRQPQQSAAFPLRYDCDRRW